MRNTSSDSRNIKMICINVQSCSPISLESAYELAGSIFSSSIVGCLAVLEYKYVLKKTFQFYACDSSQEHAKCQSNLSAQIRLGYPNLQGQMQYLRGELGNWPQGTVTKQHFLLHLQQFVVESKLKIRVALSLWTYNHQENHLHQLSILTTLLKIIFQN